MNTAAHNALRRVLLLATSTMLIPTTASAQDYPVAEQLLDEAMSVAQGILDPSTRYHIFHNLSEQFAVQGVSDSARTALAVCEGLADRQSALRRDIYLQEIASVYARIGDADAVDRCIEALAFPDSKDGVQQAIGQVWYIDVVRCLALGFSPEIAEARAREWITAPGVLTDALVAVADVAATIGNAAKATELLAWAASLAEAERACDDLAAIGDAMLRAGSSESASSAFRAAARAVDGDTDFGTKTDVIDGLVRCGLASEAMELARTLGKASVRHADWFIETVIRAMLEAGDPVGAVESVPLVQDDARKQYCWSNIAQYYGRTGNPAMAVTVTKQLKDPLRRVITACECIAALPHGEAVQGSEDLFAVAADALKQLARPEDIVDGTAHILRTSGLLGIDIHEEWIGALSGAVSKLEGPARQDGAAKAITALWIIGRSADAEELLGFAEAAQVARAGAETVWVLHSRGRDTPPAVVAVAKEYAMKCAVADRDVALGTLALSLAEAGLTEEPLELVALIAEEQARLNAFCNVAYKWLLVGKGSSIASLQTALKREGAAVQSRVLVAVAAGMREPRGRAARYVY